MALTRVERERISDTRMKIQAAAETLSGLSAGHVSDLPQIQDCLEDAEKSLSKALRSESSHPEA
jgi:hypothetical protein